MALGSATVLVAFGAPITLRRRPLPRYGAGFVRVGAGPTQWVVYRKPDRFENRGLARLDDYLDRVRSGRRATLVIQREDDVPGLIVRRRAEKTEVALSFQSEPSRPERERRIEAFFRTHGVHGRLGLLTPVDRKVRPSDLEYPLPAALKGQRALVSDGLRELFGTGSEDGLSYDLEVSE